MTTKREYLLQCLAEEAAEVAQAASKCLRFGLDNEWPGYEGNALSRLLREVVDFMTVLEMLSDELDVELPSDLPGAPDTLIEAKRKKVLEMMEYSRQRGILKE